MRTKPLAVLGGSVAIYAWSPPMLSTLAVAAAFVALASPAREDDLSPYRLSTIALSGQHAPGVPEHIFAQISFTSPFMYPQIGPSGIIRIPARAADATSSCKGIWTTLGPDHRELRLELLEGDPAAGTDGVFDGFGDSTVVSVPLAMNRCGDAAFNANLDLSTGSTTGTNQFGVWITSIDDDETGSSTSLVTRSAAPVPTIPGAEFGRILRQQLLLNDHGESVFFGALRSGSGGVTFANSSGIWMSTPGATPQHERTLVQLWRAGDPAPGIPGKMFSHLRWSPDTPFAFLDWNNQSTAAFVAPLVDEGSSSINPSPDEGLWTIAAGNLSLVARVGEARPGTGDARLVQFGRPILSDTGAIAFRATLVASEFGPFFNALCVSSDDQITIIARDGDPIEGLPGFSMRPGSINDPEPCINIAGDVLFTASIDPNPSGQTGAGSGLFHFHADTAHIELVAHSGLAVPGASGARFTSLRSHDRGRSYTLNGRGDIAFYAGIDTQHLGLFAKPAAMTRFVPIYITGHTQFAPDPVHNPADLRTVIDGIFLPSSRPYILPPSMDDRGTLVFGVKFLNETSGIFAADMQSAPGPRSPADLDGDEVVTVADFTILAASYGRTVPVGTPADINADGVVNASDFLILARELGE